MNNGEKKYKCLFDGFFKEDEQNFSENVGVAKTLDEWKQWLIDAETRNLLETFSAYDEEFINQMREIIELSSKEVIDYIQNSYLLVIEEVTNCAYISIDINKIHKEIYIDLTSNEKDINNVLEKIKVDFSLKIDEIEKENSL